MNYSPIYTCFECGKKYKFDYKNCGITEEGLTKEEYLQKIKEYEENISLIDKETVCYECLKKFVSKRDENYNKKNDSQVISEQIDKSLTKLEEEYQNKDPTLDKEKIEKEEQEAENDLKLFKAKIEEKEKELLSLMENIKKLDQEEKKFWQEYNKTEKNIYISEKEKCDCNNKIINLEGDIRKLSSTNILNDLFQISFYDKSGVINGCRMGLPFINDEINAGWGYIVFLTKILSLKFGFISKCYELIVYGNYSKIVIKEKKVLYELRYSENAKNCDKYNEAMGAFLGYFNEFFHFLIDNKKIEYDSKEFNIEINADNINNKKIIFDPYKSDEWTQCIKYLLTTLKFLIVQVLKLEDEAYKEVIQNANLLKNFSK